MRITNPFGIILDLDRFFILGIRELIKELTLVEGIKLI